MPNDLFLRISHLLNNWYDNDKPVRVALAGLFRQGNK